MLYFQPIMLFSNSHNIAYNSQETSPLFSRIIKMLPIILAHRDTANYCYLLILHKETVKNEGKVIYCIVTLVKFLYSPPNSASGDH